MCGVCVETEQWYGKEATTMSTQMRDRGFSYSDVEVEAIVAEARADLARKCLELFSDPDIAQIEISNTLRDLFKHEDINLDLGGEK